MPRSSADTAPMPHATPLALPPPKSLTGSDSAAPASVAAQSFTSLAATASTSKETLARRMALSFWA